MPDPILLVLAGSGLALGMGAARIGGPISWNWRPRLGSIQHRLRCLPRGAPPASLRALGVGLVASLLASGTLTAYAAAPGAPERLAAQAAGVVGSGDQLSLKLKASGGERTLKIGGTYEEGWTLQALTPTQATLAKDGATREVGLNPSGAIASAAPAAPPSTVSVAGMPDEATIQAAVDRALARDFQALEKLIKSGLTQDEARRILVYNAVIDDELARRLTAAGGPGATSLAPTAQRALLGDAAYADNQALIRKQVSFDKRPQIVADLAARPVTGPTSFYIPKGANYADLIKAQGIDDRGLWTNSPPDAQGGITRSLVAGTAEAYAASAPPPSIPPEGVAFTIMRATPAKPVP